MKANTKKAVIAAVVCLILGAALILAAGALAGFDYRKVGSVNHLDAKTYRIDDAFHSVRLRDNISDVRVLPAADGKCAVICGESDKIVCDIAVQNGTLQITRKDKRPWYEHIGFVWMDGDISVTLYLPEADYQSLDLLTVSGDMTVEPGLRADQVTLNTTSGDISVSELGADTLRVKSTSGELSLRSVTADSLTADTVSGDIRLQSCAMASLTLESTSGELRIQESICKDVADLNTVSGDIRFEASDAGVFMIATTSGDVTGSLLTAKNFLTDTVSGDVWVRANSSEGGECRISTVSGDIHMDLA